MLIRYCILRSKDHFKKLNNFHLHLNHSFKPGSFHIHIQQCFKNRISSQIVTIQAESLRQHS